jgi:hypothetical protein
MYKTFKLDIGKDFYPDPGGRYYRNGIGSAEELREEYLKPLLEALPEDYKLLVKLDNGVISYSSAFLSEAFGGLVFYEYFTPEFLQDKILLEYDDEEFSCDEDLIKELLQETLNTTRTYKAVAKLDYLEYKDSKAVVERIISEGITEPLKIPNKLDTKNQMEKDLYLKYDMIRTEYGLCKVLEQGSLKTSKVDEFNAYIKESLERLSEEIILSNKMPSWFNES